jgi:sigma-B regulation protein RsbU (phosphoserine phosphatase)
MFCSDDFRATRIQVEPGSSLLIYSDGLTEAVDESGNEYGLNKLMQDFQELDRITASDVVHTLSEKIGDFTGESPLADDRTILVLNRLPGGQ